MAIATVLGAGPLAVSERIGHVHITVEDASVHLIDAGGESIILAGLKPGPYKMLELRYFVQNCSKSISLAVRS